jgi:prolipoprotein diacylglyceryltransferase
MMLEEYFRREPAAAAAWHYDSLRVMVAGRDNLGHLYTQFDAQTPLHPTPLYELLMGVAGFFILLAIEKRELIPGQLFMLYLMLSSTFRFAVEFLRLQPRLAMGLSEAQLFSIAIFILGTAGYVILSRRDATPHSRA